MKFIGFIDASGIPTSIWTEYRGADHRKVLGRAIRKGYAELFSVYPDANTRANTDLQNVFAQSSSGGADVIRKTVGTFKALVESADFSDTEGGVLSSLNVTPLHQPLKAVPPGITRQTLNSGRPEVHIDIQIHISPESSNDQIDKIFESMSKHLYGRTGS